VWEDAIRQAEGGAQVSFQLRFFLDEGQELSINSLLVLFPLLCQLVLLQSNKKKTQGSSSCPINNLPPNDAIQNKNPSYLFLCIKDFSLLVTGHTQLLLLEVGIVQGFGDLHTSDVNFGVGGNDKFLVGPAQGDSVQGKRA